MDAKTSVSRDVDDFPLPDGFDLDMFREIIEQALGKEGLHGDVSITAYGEEKPDQVVSRYTDTGITFVPKVLPQDLAPEHGSVPDVNAAWFWEKLLDGEQTMPWRDLCKLVGLGKSVKVSSWPS